MQPERNQVSKYLLIPLALLMSSCATVHVPDIAPDVLPINDYYRSRLILFDTYIHEDVALIGDSLTEGYPDTSVLNFGIKSDNSIGLQTRLNQVISVKPRVCFILVGTNQYRNEFLWYDLLAMRSRLIGHGITPVLTTIPYVAKSKHSYTNLEINEFNRRIRRSGFDYIELCLATADGNNLDSKLTTDGTHFNADGYVIWESLVNAYLSSMVPKTGQTS